MKYVSLSETDQMVLKKEPVRPSHTGNGERPVFSPWCIHLIFSGFCAYIGIGIIFQIDFQEH